MLSVLREKVRSLIFGEDGVALVVTLASFFFMYLMAMGVYAVGTSVKERIHLQNACDAAAYSAAVVQADTLSRIATINRAMSWTYVQMTRRQMDYIVWRWLQNTSDAYWGNLEEAQKSGSPGEPEHFHQYWQDCDDLRDLTLNGHWKILLSDVKSVLEGFPGHLSDYTSSFYSAPGNLKQQIVDDKATIREMVKSIWGSEDGQISPGGLVFDLPTRVETVVQNILDANLATNGNHSVWQENDVFRRLASDEESDFLRFSGYADMSDSPVFGSGSGLGEWFPLGNGEGFVRSYVQLADRLLSEWTWWYREWQCSPESGCVPTTSTSSNVVRGSDAEDENFKGQRAIPCVLKQDYFGSAGTITVGFTCENENPWLPVLKTITGGLFSAFDPYCKKTVVFASAKAGYRTYDEGMSRGRNYQIDWKDEEGWNLYTSDWDAVLIPVRMAKTMATDRRWDLAEGNFLGEWVEQLGVKDDEMRAGGEDALADPKLPTGDEESLSAWWRKLSAAPNRTFAVQTKWQVGSPHQRPTWNKLTNRMFH